MSTPVTPKGGIYVIRLSPIHYYGGRSKDFRVRWRDHLRALEAGVHGNRRMQAVYNIHKQFEPEAVVPWTEGLDLKEAEQRWLDENYGKPGCVNLLATSDGGGAASLGRKNTEETKQLMSRSAKARAAAHPTAHGEDTRKLISTQQKGRVWVRDATTNRRVLPDEVEALLAQGWTRGTLRGKAHPRVKVPHLGRKNTPETIRRMSESAKARAAANPITPERRALLSLQRRGRTWVHNDAVNRNVWPSEAQELIAQGWVPGRVSIGARPRKVRTTPPPVSLATRTLLAAQRKGTVWVHNETVNRRVWPEEARELIAQGWLPNRLPNRK